MLKVNREQILKILDDNGYDYKVVGDWARFSCPFHQENEPSFGVNLDTGGYNCFGCGVTGSLVNLIEKLDLQITGLHETDTINRHLLKKKMEALKDGIDGVEYHFKSSYEFKELTLKKNRQSLYSKDMMRYIKKRRIGVKAIRKFKIGYMKGLNHPFKNRLVIPVFDENGVLVWYEGRDITDKKKTEKWWRSFNSRSNKILFNLNNIHDYNYVIIVEGIFDVIRLWSYGYNVVCIFGTEIGADQLIKLYRFDTVYMCYDGDMSGRRALGKLKKNANELYGTEFRYLKLPLGCDPNDISKKMFKKIFFNSVLIT